MKSLWKQNINFRLRWVYKVCTDTNLNANMYAQLQPCALSLCTLWFGQWESPAARASSIDTGLASFSAWPSVCPTQRRLHAGGVSAMDGWTAAQTWRTQTKKEEVQDKHVVPPSFSIYGKLMITRRWQQYWIKC